MQAKGAFGGPFAAVTCAYVVRGLVVARGGVVTREARVLGVAGKGVIARGP